MGIDIEGSANPDSLTRGTVEFGVSGISTPQVLLNSEGTNGKNIDLSCFVRGSCIHLVTGETRVEDIQLGDQVITRDNGFQFVRWIGSTKRPSTGENAPILFKSGSIGNDEDLMVSPNHRVLVQDCKSDGLNSKNETLIAAKSMINGTNIVAVEADEADYFYIGFDQGELVHSHGVWTESSCTGGIEIEAIGDRSAYQTIRFQRRNIVCSRNDLGPQPKLQSIQSHSCSMRS